MLPDCFWSLYNTADEIRVDGLRTLQIQALLRGFARTSLNEWLVWQEGTTDWRSASDVLTQMGGSQTSPQSPPTPPPVAGTPQGPFINIEKAPKASHAKTDGSEDEDNSPGAKLPPDQRMTPRFEIQLKAYVNSKGRLLPNETVNISVGGIKFKNPLPNDIEASFDVTLMNQGNELVLRCHGVKTKAEQMLTRVMIQSCNRMDILRMWIVNAPQVPAPKPET